MGAIGFVDAAGRYIDGESLGNAVYHAGRDLFQPSNLPYLTPAGPAYGELQVTEMLLEPALVELLMDGQRNDLDDRYPGPSFTWPQGMTFGPVRPHTTDPFYYRGEAVYLDEHQDRGSPATYGSPVNSGARQAGSNLQRFGPHQSMRDPRLP
jgi:hypothetical protein